MVLVKNELRHESEPCHEKTVLQAILKATCPTTETRQSLERELKYNVRYESIKAANSSVQYTAEADLNIC